MYDHVYLAIDAGTTKMKGALVDQTGSVLALADRDVIVEKPHEGWCELDMDEVYETFCSITNELASIAPEGWKKIEGIGVSGQGDGCWPIDSDGKPVRNAVLWNDTRDKNLQIDNIDEIREYLIENKGAPAVVGTQPRILRWLKENELENYAKIRWTLHCKDWLNYRMTGELASEYSDGSTATINVFEKKYLDGLYEMLDVPEGKGMQPPLHNSKDIVGHITERASEETKIPVGVPVIAGALDVAAVALGAGATKIGDGCSILGTALCNVVILGQQQVDHRDTAGSALCHVVPEAYVRLMGTLSGCSSLDWARSIYAQGMSFDELERGMREIPLGANGVTYHPYIYGERSPFRNPNACGGFYGITAKTTRFDLLRAVYEGLILMMKDCYHHLPACGDTIYLSGGGANSDLLCEMAASALGKNTVRLEEKELGILGIAKTLNVALGGKTFEEMSAEKVGRIFAPNPEEIEKWDEMYDRFVAIRDSMIPHWDARAKSL